MDLKGGRTLLKFNGSNTIPFVYSHITGTFAGDDSRYIKARTLEKVDNNEVRKRRRNTLWFVKASSGMEVCEPNGRDRISNMLVPARSFVRDEKRSESLLVSKFEPFCWSPTSSGR
jgi:hypothetical protein